MAAKVLNVTNEASLLREAGSHFLDVLRQNANRPDAPEAIRRDWKVVATWLNHVSGDLSPEQTGKLERAWLAYLRIGLAPSFALQPAFEYFARQIGEVPRRDRPPIEVMGVFDRQLASLPDIIAKRGADRKSHEERLRSLTTKADNGERPNWWRQQAPILRTWLFASSVWIVAMGLYLFYFDPLEIDRWEYIGTDEMAQVALILLATLGAGAFFYVYQRWVR